MKGKTLLFYLFGSISLVIAVVLFFKWLDLKLLLPMILAVAAVAFFWIGSSVQKK